MKNFLKITAIIIAVLVVDLTTKHFLFNVEYFNLIPNVISIAGKVENTGAAWGIFSGKTISLVMVSVLMIIALLIFNRFVKNKSMFYCIAFGFVLGGALGNLFDRIMLQYVRDFIFLDFMPKFPVFNMADSFLCVGAVMLAIHILFMSEKKDAK